MATLSELQTYRAALEAVRYSGVREVRDASGESISYRSQREVETAIAALDLDIARLSGATRSRFVQISYGKGLD